MSVDEIQSRLAAAMLYSGLSDVIHGPSRSAEDPKTWSECT
jgi:hypothetical protein